MTTAAPWLQGAGATDISARACSHASGPACCWPTRVKPSAVRLVGSAHGKGARGSTCGAQVQLQQQTQEQEASWGELHGGRGWAEGQVACALDHSTRLTSAEGGQATNYLGLEGLHGEERRGGGGLRSPRTRQGGPRAGAPSQRFREHRPTAAKRVRGSGRGALLSDKQLCLSWDPQEPPKRCACGALRGRFARPSRRHARLVAGVFWCDGKVEVSIGG